MMLGVVPVHPSKTPRFAREPADSQIRLAGVGVLPQLDHTQAAASAAVIPLKHHLRAA